METFSTTHDKFARFTGLNLTRHKQKVPQMCSQREDDDLPLTAVDNIQILGIWNKKTIWQNMLKIAGTANLSYYDPEVKNKKKKQTELKHTRESSSGKTIICQLACLS